MVFRPCLFPALIVVLEGLYQILTGDGTWFHCAGNSIMHGSGIACGSLRHSRLPGDVRFLYRHIHTFSQAGGMASFFIR